MPDVSKYETILQDLKNGTYRTLGLNIGAHEVAPGEKIVKGGKIVHMLYYKIIMIFD